MKDSSVGENVSAFAVYRNLIPGLKSYEDHKAKKQNKKKPKKEKDVVSIPENSKQTLVNPHADSKKTQNQSIASKKLKTAVQSNGTKDNDSIQTNSKQAKKRKANEIKEQDKETISKANSSTSNKIPKLHAAKEITKPKKPKIVNLNNVNGVKDAIEKKSGKKKAKEQASPFTEQAIPTTKSKTKEKQIPGLKSMSKQQARKQNPPTNPSPIVKADEKHSKISIKSLINSKPVENSEEHGKSLFEWIISPVKSNVFFSEYWEKKPLHIQHGSKYFKWILSSEILDDIMRSNKLYFGRNVDLTSYTDGVRETHNPDGRALPAVVWDFYSNGCSVRILNPQTYIPNLWRLNASLQELFGTFVGANVYLTPPDTQGFAPHYDDIEAFILQVEGKKHWKLYAPRLPSEELPRLSSGNFNEETDNLGKPILDVVLEEGDILYFPRGTIHQAKAVDGEHSLHITVSCYQTNTYGDLLKEFLPMALERAQANMLQFRKGLPTDYLSYMGTAHMTSKSKSIVQKRKDFHKVIQNLVGDLLKQSCDDAADQLGKKFMFDALPPYLIEKERERTVYEDGEFMRNGCVFNSCEIDPDVEIKLIRKNCLRLVMEDNLIKIYYTLENSLEYHAEEPQVLEIPEESLEAIRYLISKYPQYTKIQDLPIKDEILRLQTASDLWEKGLLLTKVPLTPTDGGEAVDEVDDEGESIEVGSASDNDLSDADEMDERHEDSLSCSSDSNSEESENDE